MVNLGRLGIPIAVLATAVLSSAPAMAADRDDYLGPLMTRYTFLSSHQLLTEASRVCGLIETGRSSSEAVPMVSKDLQVSVPAATDITLAAAAYLNC